MASILDIVTGISSIVSQKGYDGAEGVKIGLKREEGDPVIDSRVMDGFKVRFSGNKMIVTYQGEERLKDIYKSGPDRYDQEIEQRMKDISDFIVKEYNKLGRGNLRLKEEGACDAVLQNISNYRTFVQAIKHYTIQGVEAEAPKSEEQRMFKNFKP